MCTLKDFESAYLPAKVKFDCLFMYYALSLLGKGSSNEMLGVIKGITVLVMQWKLHVVIQSFMLQTKLYLSIS